MNTDQTPAPDYDMPLPTEHAKAWEQTQYVRGEYEVRTMDTAARIVLIAAATFALVTAALAIYGGVKLIDAVM